MALEEEQDLSPSDDQVNLNATGEPRDMQIVSAHLCHVESMILTLLLFGVITEQTFDLMLSCVPLASTNEYGLTILMSQFSRIV